MIVVQDEDYPAAIEKFKDAGFIQTVPNRSPPREILVDHPDPQRLLEKINARYKLLDRSCTVFNYPDGSPEVDLQVYLFPNSFTHLLQGVATGPLKAAKPTSVTQQFDVYGRLHYPLEQALVNSFVTAAIDEEDEMGFSAWSQSLRAWISLMAGYLEVNNDILDQCPDKRAVEWYSTNFGRIREAKSGPLDRRITKRLGSGKEMPIDMRGNPVLK
jgi:hypothetical protein